MDKGVLADKATVNLGLDFFGQHREAQLVQIQRATSQLVVNQWIVVHDLDVQIEILEFIWKIIKDDGFSVDRVLGAALLAGLLRAVVLVEEDSILFEVENNVRVALADQIVIVQVGYFVEEDGEFAHGVSSAELWI
jgi:hypothetical protein